MRDTVFVIAWDIICVAVRVQILTEENGHRGHRDFINCRWRLATSTHAVRRPSATDVSDLLSNSNGLLESD